MSRTTLQTAADPLRTPGPADTAPTARRWLVLPVLCLSVFLVVVDNTIVNVALPTLNTHLGASITSLQASSSSACSPLQRRRRTPPAL